MHYNSNTTTMKQLIYAFMSVAMLSLLSCESWSSSSDSTTDSTAQEVDSTALNTGEITVTGVVFDGSRRNIYLAAGNDTLDFELSPEMDEFSWEIGDTITVKYVTTDYGDSVTYVGAALGDATAMR